MASLLYDWFIEKDIYLFVRYITFNGMLIINSIQGRPWDEVTVACVKALS
jgi:hypothetical protein